MHLRNGSINLPCCIFDSFLAQTDMKKFLVLLLSTVVLVGITRAQLVADNTIGVEEAVQILLGEGVEVFNVTFSGGPEQIGSFECNGCNIGIENGFIIASGDVQVAQGPNSLGSATLGGGFFGATDPDLELINPNFATNDAAVLEFDFIAGGDQVEFRYVWSSEEYPEYVFSSFNDVFGFFLSGPGINGPYTNNAVNIALVPGTNLPVTIDNVNNGNGGFGPCTNCQYYVNNDFNPSPLSVQFDGFTTVLTASASNLECGETYHIKIAVADAGDTAYDSAVFIEAGSFASNTVLINSSASIDTPVFLGDSVVVEGCNTAQFEIFRPYANSEEIIELEISGTAENGIDIDPAIPETVTMEAGENSVYINFSAVLDNLDEDLESITLEYTYLNACGDSVEVSSTLYIAPYLFPQLNSPDVFAYCPGPGGVAVTAVPFLGYEPFTFEWDNGQTTQSINVNPEETTTYTVTATDVCGETVTETIDVIVEEIPPLLLNVENVTALCPGDPIQIGVEVSSGAQGYNFLWNNNQNQQNITVSPIVTTTYTVTVTDQCDQEASASLIVEVPQYEEVTASSADQSSYCPGDEVEISAMGAGGLAPYTYDWGIAGNGEIITVAPFSTTTYFVTITDACGETANAQAEVIVNQWNEPISASTDTICGGGSGFIGPITGGTGIYVNLYSTPEGFSYNATDPAVVSAPTVTSETPFTIFIVDECGNTGSIPVIVKPCETIVPNIITPNADDINDGFTIFGIENFPNSTLIIYNRWGNLVYEEGNYQNTNPWDGSDLSDGVYFWVLKRSDGNEYNGTVVLKRD